MLLTMWYWQTEYPPTYLPTQLTNYIQQSSLRTNQSLTIQENSLHSMEPKGSLLHSQMPTTCPNQQPDAPVHAHPFSNVTFLSITRPSKWVLPFRFPHQNPVCILLLPHVPYVLLISTSSNGSPTNPWRAVQIVKMTLQLEQTSSYKQISFNSTTNTFSVLCHQL
jgi:hypothetical protein